MRVTNAPASRKRRTRMIRAAKGFRMRRSKLYRYASDAVDHGRQYAFRDRKTKKRNFRRLWQIRINAAARAAGTTYTRSMEGFKGLMKQLGTVPKEEKPAAGKAINSAKAELEAALAERRSELELKAALPQEPTDFTLPGRRRPLGKIHPLTQVTEEIVRSFRKIGFAVADGPEVEDEYHCFDALNTPADHPARDTQDTFYLSTRPAQSSTLLRTHTSSVQIRVMESQQPPVRIIVPGRVYRRDNADATHNPTFHQVEGLYVDRNVTVGDLKGTVEFVFKELMGAETRIRFRPHYFSYTEPSFEIDFSSQLTRKMGKEWLEIAGCGMVHPQVFENVGYDPEVWSGWAFGFGIERIAMIRYGITDIRLFYENDVRFLKQF